MCNVHLDICEYLVKMVSVDQAKQRARRGKIFKSMESLLSG